jgi:hypothetical protein
MVLTANYFGPLTIKVINRVALSVAAIAMVS